MPGQPELHCETLRNPGQGGEGKRLGEGEEENGLFTSLLP